MNENKRIDYVKVYDEMIDYESNIEDNSDRLRMFRLKLYNDKNLSKKNDITGCLNDMKADIDKYLDYLRELDD